MKEFDNIVTRLPYKESETDVDAIVERSRAVAGRLAAARGKTRRAAIYSLTAMAAAAAIALAVVLPAREEASFMTDSPMDAFLASISDAEAQMIADPQIEDIPEYYR